jgi:hypothetical protein
MNSYHLCIADAPKKIAAKIRHDIPNHCCINVLSHPTGTRPRPRSASGTLPYFRTTVLQLLISTGQGTRSVASAAGSRYRR